MQNGVLHVEECLNTYPSAIFLSKDLVKVPAQVIVYSSGALKKRPGEKETEIVEG